MSLTREIPNDSPSDLSAGLRAASVSHEPAGRINQRVLQLACVSLICNLESLHAKACEKPRGQQVADSSTTAGSMLIHLLDFATNFLSHNLQEQVRELILLAADACEVHKEIQRNQSWGHALKNIFKPDEVSPDVLASNAALCKALVRASTATFQSAADLIDPTSNIKSQFQHSSTAFLDDLRNNW